MLKSFAVSRVFYHVTTRAVSTSSILCSSDGSIREAGGSFARKEKAIEDQYFYKLQAAQLSKLKNVHKDEIQQQQMEIKRLQALIERHKEEISELEGHEDDLKKN